jgi:chemotaxis-related protein WspD
MKTSLPSETSSERCWRSIGVWGDQSCQELKVHLHCQNCDVYIQSGRQLFQQPAPPDYLAEWTQLLTDEKEEVDDEQVSVIIFRIASEWFALPTKNFVEVHEFRSIHRIPHVSDQTLLGLTNVRGALHLCVSLRQLLNLSATEAAEDWCQSDNQTRIAVIENEGEQWACKLDEIDGLLRFSPDLVHEPPVTVSQTSSTFTKGVITNQDKPIALLDGDLLFHYLKNNLT